MVSTTTALVLLLVFLVSNAFAVSSEITLGSSLYTDPTDQHRSAFWLSPSGNFAFGFYPLSSSFVIGIWLAKTPEKTLVWSANRNDPPLSKNTSLHLTQAGKLIVRSPSANLEKAISNIVEPAISASMLDNGNFVLYGSDSQIIWSSFKFPTDTILGGQSLENGHVLLSAASETRISDGNFKLFMQEDGNLVMYPVNTTPNSTNAYWSTGTNGCGNGITLNLDPNGHLFLLNSNRSIIHNIAQEGNLNPNNGSYIYRATIGINGNFQLFAHGFESSPIVNDNLWSAVEDPCEVKGICGINSYCTLRHLKYPSCVCLPGFDPARSSTSSDETFLNCETSLKNGVCGNGTNTHDFTMVDLENVEFEDAKFENLPPVSEAECITACEDDCNCLFSLFMSTKCSVVNKNQTLRYGKTTVNQIQKGFFKVKTTGNDSALLPPIHRPKSSVIPSPEIKLPAKPSRNWFILAVALAICLILVVALSVLRFFIDRSRNQRYKDFAAYVVTNEVNLRSFRYTELEEATGGFEQELGRGSFGAVFRGALFGDVEIAVKRLDRVVEEGEKQFRTEMNIIGRTHHRNLVRLLGYCNEGPHKLLVYEFMSNGSLADLLFKEERRPKWEERVRISLEIARGLMYLHHECETQIIHCDIKPSNILLNGTWVPKISDFGLSKLLEPDQTRTFTGARGTRGYVAPEWSRNIPINAGVDIYSFGVMLLEIICCRKSLMVSVPVNEILLSEWVYDCFTAGKLEKLVDHGEVESGIEKKRLERLVMVGLWCVQEDPSLRPSMKRVVLMLEGTVDVLVPPYPNPQSFIANHNENQHRSTRPKCEDDLV